MPSPGDEFDRFRISKVSSNNREPTALSPQSNEWFLKGPIPGPWLQIATSLPGRALHVGLALWFMCGLTKQKEVRVTQRARQRFSIPPDAFRRGLEKLEAAGLVSVIRRRGRAPLITVLDAPNTDPEEKENLKSG